MKYFAAFFVLIPAFLLFGLAYRGYADMVSSRPGDFDRYASRVSDGFSFDSAQQQSRLVIAGIEGIAGLVFLYTAMSISSSAGRKQQRETAREGMRPRPLPYQQRTSEPVAPIVYAQPGEPQPERRRSLIQSGRERIEALRNARNLRRRAEDR